MAGRRTLSSRFALAAPTSGKVSAPGPVFPVTLLGLVGLVVLIHGWIDRQIENLTDIDLARGGVSTVVLDRDDKLLRAYTAHDGRWRLPLGVDDVDQRYLAMLLAYEDERFYFHNGVDAIGVMRAGLLAVRHGRFVSGASTLTMQVARCWSVTTPNRCAASGGKCCARSGWNGA